VGRPIVDIQKLSFTYSGSVSPALDAINLQVLPGEFITVTGASGCGKSTLVLCMAGFIPYAFHGKMEGLVRVQEKDTRDYPAGGLSGIVGLVQQDPEAQLCTLRVRDEVAFGPENLCLPPELIRERVQFALAAVGASDLRDRLVHTLSGGEKQRVAIASVLAMNPLLLILDEPTANLDPSCTLEIVRVLERLRKEQAVSVIVVEHRLEKLVSISDRLVVLERGRIIEDGPPGEDRKIYVSPRTCLSAGSWQRPDNSSGGLMAGGLNSPVLSVENLVAGYEGGDVLTGAGFDLYPGETVAVMGDNGSGKTTLILSLLGIVRPRQGSVSYKGVDITAVKVTRRARDMGLTFQNPNHQLFEDTVLKEAALPSLFLSSKTAGETDRIIDLLLEKFGLRQYREKNPFTLSLGEKKRLTLVSVLAYAPDVLILDEPLVGQDSQRLHLLMDTLEEHRQRGGLTLMVCHEPAVVAAFCHRILFLDQGRLIIDAPVHEAFQQLARLGKEEYLPAGYLLKHWGNGDMADGS
jgi:energy-coupling factor transport system ATP-binding protein